MCKVVAKQPNVKIDLFESIELTLCDDCTQMIANGEYSGDEYDPDAIEFTWPASLGWVLTIDSRCEFEGTEEESEGPDGELVDIPHECTDACDRTIDLGEDRNECDGCGWRGWARWHRGVAYRWHDYTGQIAMVIEFAQNGGADVEPNGDPSECSNGRGSGHSITVRGYGKFPVVADYAIEMGLPIEWGPKDSKGNPVNVTIGTPHSSETPERPGPEIVVSYSDDCWDESGALVDPWNTPGVDVSTLAQTVTVFASNTRHALDHGAPLGSSWEMVEGRAYTVLMSYGPTFEADLRKDGFTIEIDPNGAESIHDQIEGDDESDD